MFCFLKRLLKRSRLFPVASLLLAITFLSGCWSETNSQTTKKPGQINAGVSAELTPELVAIFSQDCAQCHTKASTGAPLVGDAQAWRKILSKGIDETLDRTLNGYGGMPPAGRCFECTQEQLKQLIYFMSQGA
mgnify:CR=1 FL=1